MGLDSDKIAQSLFIRIIQLLPCIHYKSVSFSFLKANAQLIGQVRRCAFSVINYLLLSETRTMLVILIQRIVSNMSFVAIKKWQKKSCSNIHLIKKSTCKYFVVSFVLMVEYSRKLEIAQLSGIFMSSLKALLTTFIPCL